MGGAAIDRSVKASLVILSVLGLLAFCYYAASVLIAILSSLLIALALDPFVEFMARRLRLGRTVSSLIAVFFGIAALYAILYVAYISARQLFADLPLLIEHVRNAPLVQRIADQVSIITETLREAGRSMAPGASPEGDAASEFVIRDGKSWVETLFEGIGSLTTVVFSLSFIPFLVYFMLAGKDLLFRKTRELFSEDRQETAGDIIHDIERMMRRFILGNAVVAVILGLATSLVFLLVGLPHWPLLGMLSGTLSTIPYLGFVLALLPPVVVGLVVFEGGGPLLLIGVAVSVFHLLAANYLIPRFVGSGVRLNAVAATMAIMFFGWMWGGMGLVLGIPIVAVAKCVMDNVESTRAFGAWLGD